jgi:soluble lytic murein transglycosylase
VISRYRESARVWSDPIGRALMHLHLRPNHLTLIGLGVSLAAAAAFVTGHIRTGGALLLLAGLCDFFDGALARASGTVTPFGAFLDSVIDRYSDIVVVLAIVVLFARLSHTRGALVAMAGLVGTVMVSYTKARAASIGVECTIGFMERPERMICLIAGALGGVLEPALWVLAILANLTALQRIAFTWRATRDAAILRGAAVAALLLVPAAVTAEPRTPVAVTAEPHTPAAETTAPSVPPATERRWAQAIAAYQGGDPGPLLAEMSTPAALQSPIGDYVRWLLADAFARRGDWTGARAMAASVAERHRESRLAPRALLVAAWAASRAGDDRGAQRALGALIDRYPESAELPEALYLLGMTAEALGTPEAAAAIYRELTLVAPAGGYASGARDRLTALARAGTSMPELSHQERLDRAERLFRGGVLQGAADEADRIATEAPDAGIAVTALKIVAEASRRLGRYDVAARALDLAVSRAPAERRPGLQLDQARLLLRAGGKERDKDGNVRALQLLAAVASTGGDAEASEAMYLRARHLEDVRRDAEAMEAFRALAARFPAREVAGSALWRVGWLAYLRGDMRGAEQSWTRLRSAPGGRAHRLAAVYWSGRIQDQQGARDAARQLYGTLLEEAPRSYYGVLAEQRLAGARDLVRPTGEPSIHLPANPRDALAGDPGFARVDLLRRLGLVDLALVELEDVVRRSAGDSQRLYGLTGAYVEDERYDLALRIMRANFAGLAATGNPGIPRAFWEMLYPFAWRAEVEQAAGRARVDPFLVAAVVREESNYYPRAVSRAGARGLMQLMPATAQPLAVGRGWPFRGGDLLDEPAANVELGTSFLAGLLREFGDPRLALAAYNAGPRRARQWWQARRGDDVEVFVEEIPFDETRFYVKRVMLSWEEYRRLYGGRAAGR